jgi:hypothetical protein
MRVDAMSNRSIASRRAAQRGITTLLLTSMILFLAALVTLALSRTALMEQRMAGNQIRHKQAFEAAQEGLDRSMVFLQSAPRGVDKDADDVADAGPLLAPVSGVGPSYYVAFCQPNSTATCPDTPGAPTCAAAVQPVNFNTPLVVACGWSDDLIGRTLITQRIGAITTLSAPPQNPLTAKGTTSLQGSSSVVNLFNNLTIWSGGSLTLTGSAKTFVRNPSLAPPAAGTDPPAAPNACSTSTEYVCASDDNNTGPDVMDADTALASLTNASMFENFFGVPTRAAFEKIASQTLAPAAFSTAAAGLRGESVVITGSVTLPNATIGTRERPVLLLVDGDLSFTGTPDVHGIVYVTGNVTGGGNPRIQGAMVVQGNVSPTGSLDLIHDPFVVSNAATLTGRVGWAPGTWRDWN